ncbi:hydrolase [Heyndrickxia vini]|uniref:Hydrolase n=1 Tax=Heyndrickxia vini TaxID=1476025 RepID=A0ABX7E5I0_9BACI|nr:hydrolase [Heyndrickxia vini]QQZ10543.1 hydrolase [Heyndrickxia vini]
MDQQKNTYYINVGSGEISRSSTDSPWNFKIEATDEEITRLRQIFDANYDEEIDGFLRAHVPFMEYHHDRSNDEYDKHMIEVYQMIYELGDQEAKRHIDKIGILRDFTSE